MSENIKYGFIKPSLDAHTLGINSVVELLKECKFEVIIGNEIVSHALSDYKNESSKNTIIKWVTRNNINRIGISYRLDEDDAASMVRVLVDELRKSSLLKSQGGVIEAIYYAGLPKTCQIIDEEFNGLVKTFVGGESVYETLSMLGVPNESIPSDVYAGSKYDEMLLNFGKSIIDSREYLDYKPNDRSNYKEYGSNKDTVVKRIEASLKSPLMRAHVGPYNSSLTRDESVSDFLHWSKSLAATNYLDILSIGSSQLTQSNFDEDWGDKLNGGGVPINSHEEYKTVWDAARPMLVRTYAGTKNIPKLAQIHEETLNISWHALSLWWFNQLDERGPYDLYTNLKSHIETIKYIATTDKPFEANVSHHFAFRGADDVTYIVSAYLAAKLAKINGVKTFILQNMLNTPRLTWGIQDLAKSRAMLKLVKSLEDKTFKVLLQPRAGLDYFKPNLDDAKIQLAAVSALMDDIDPNDEITPQIIHVVSYSEAVHLATPDIIDESIKITQFSIKKYRELRKNKLVMNMNENEDVEARFSEVYESALKVITAIETHITDVYTPEGFFKVFAAGFLPVPYLWGNTSEFKLAKNWRTKPFRGSIKLVNEENEIIDTDSMIEIAVGNISEAERLLKNRIETNHKSNI